ncbi:CHAT domain-containing protein [Nodosilinea sp. LEGE 07298]|uniref:CHAT domain-containing protein n=1 Tax=Nodosilinea sp. LEGE 07298 TaxID=2777970 RepID=UPI00187ED0DF|nr:CHAT domain-containing protein [Nodosilinea sp. LEGE 07298]MBE9110530.1 CHAT domain-containing protein [Nodosilinea sp. LEGE 07298]
MGRQYGMVALLVAISLGYLPAPANPLIAPVAAQVATGTVTGELNRNSQVLNDGSYYNAYTFEGIAGETVVIEMSSPAFDTYLMLLDADGNLIAEDDDGGGSTHSRIALTLPASGTYQIYANAYDSRANGQYSLSLQSRAGTSLQPVAIRSPASSSASASPSSSSSVPSQQASNTTASPEELVQGEPRISFAGRLEPHGLTDSPSMFGLVSFQGVAGDTVVIEVSSNDFLPQLELKTRIGRDLEDRSGSRLVARLPNTGLYDLYILPHDYNSQTTGSYQLTVWVLEQADNQQEESLSADLPPYVLDFRRDSSNPFFLTGVGTDVIPNMEQEVARSRQQLGDRHLQVAENLALLAFFYQDQNREADAERAWSEALSIYREQPQEYPSAMANILTGLAMVASNRGQYREAEAFYQEAIAIHQSDLDSQDPTFAGTLTGLAYIYQMQSRYGETETLLIQVLDFYRKGEDPLEMSFPLRWLANLYHAQGDYSRAESLYQEALSIQRDIFAGGGEYSTITEPMVGNDLALLYHAQGRYDEAEQLYQRSIQQLQSSVFLGSSISSSIRVTYNLAGLYQSQGKLSEAIATLKAGLDIEQQELATTLASLGEAERQLYIATLANAIDYAVPLHLNTAPNNQEVAQLSLTTLLQRKGRVLEANMRTLETLRQNSNPEILPVLSQIENLRQEIATLSARQSEASSAQDQARLTELNSRLNQLESLLARRSAATAEGLSPVALNAVAEQIPQNGVLIEYVRYRPFDPVNLSSSELGTPNIWAASGFAPPRYAAYMLLPSGEVRGVDLGDAATIDGQIQRFLEDLRCGEQLATPCYEPEELKPVAQALYEKIFAPIQQHLGEATHLLISPDSQLNLVPFAALVDEQNRYLIETYALTHLTSGRDLLRMQSQAPSQQPPVVLADPNFDTADATGVMQVASASRGGARSADLASLPPFSRLEGSAQEVAAIRPLLGEDAVVLTEARATENALKQVQGPSILHLATHGFFLEDEPVPPPNIGGGELPQSSIRLENPLLRSGLALAGFNQRESDGEDGVLTALEVAGLNLRGTRLVVLSACETGLGDIADGEGVYGLRRAFVMAGAESQLMSLWQVSDRGTADLMQQYYERLSRGEGRSEALRQVQLTALENPVYRHPYHWAAFFFSGQWTPMDRL